MAMTDFTIIRRSMSSRLFSTITTALTVAVAVALLLTLLSMRKAGQQAFERGSGNMHLLVSGDASPMVAVLNGVFYANAPARPIPWAKFQEIEVDPRVDWAIPTQQGDSFQGFPVMATTPDFFAKFAPEEDRPWALASGAFLKNDFDVVLGAQAAAGTGLRIGEELHLTHGTGNAREAHVHEEFTYKVVGILRPTGTPHDRAVFTTLGSTWMVHANERMEREDGHDHDHAGADHDHDHGHENPKIELTDADRLVTGAYVRMATRRGANVSASMPQFAAELRKQGGFTVASPSDEMKKLFVIVSNVDIIFRAMAVIVLLSSAIAIMLALYNSMNERRRQIAVLRVLGSSRARIFGLVITESALLGVLGVIAGLALAVAGGAAAAGVLQSRVGLVIRPSWSLDWVVPVVVGAVLLAALAGVIPAVMAYRTSVAKNLKPVG
jgi:putative ABC transport system permease protein